MSLLQPPVLVLVQLLLLLPAQPGFTGSTRLKSAEQEDDIRRPSLLLGVPSVFVNIEHLEVESGGEISLSLNGGGQVGGWGDGDGGGDGGGQDVRVGHHQGTGVQEQGRPNDKFLEDFGNKTQKMPFSQILASLPSVLGQVLADRCSRRPGGCRGQGADRCSRRPGGCRGQPGLREHSKQMDIEIPEGTSALDDDSQAAIDTNRPIDKDETNKTHLVDLTDNILTESFTPGQKDNRELNRTGDLSQNVDKDTDSLWNVVLLGHQEHGTNNVSKSIKVWTDAEKENIVSNKTDNLSDNIKNKPDNLWNVVLLGHQEEDTKRVTDFTKGLTEKPEYNSEANKIKDQDKHLDKKPDSLWKVVLLGHKTNDNRNLSETSEVKKDIKDTMADSQNIITDGLDYNTVDVLNADLAIQKPLAGALPGVLPGGCCSGLQLLQVLQVLVRLVTKEGRVELLRAQSLAPHREKWEFFVDDIVFLLSPREMIRVLEKGGEVKTIKEFNCDILEKCSKRYPEKKTKPRKKKITGKKKGTNKGQKHVKEILRNKKKMQQGKGLSKKKIIQP